MKNYIHKVNYYETDKMGITHHSNYIRWMEEARIFWLDGLGYSMTNIKTGDLVLIGRTKHCFLGKDNRPIILKKESPEFDALMKSLI